MGDFIGFTFNGMHSEDLGITRVSSGDRYSEDLFPEVKDISTDIPGMDGEYYFGSQFGTRPFSIEIAYDHLTEKQFRQIRQVFHQKQIGELIFDERPYKKYLVKIESPIELSFVCFDEPKKIKETITDGIKWNGSQTHVIEREDPTGATERIYKGEGTIEFIGYYPFAKSVYKVLSSTDENADWASSSGILSKTEKERYHIDEILMGATNISGTELYYPDPGSNGVIVPLYNKGDFETSPVIFFPIGGAYLHDATISLSDGSGLISIADLEPNRSKNELGFIVNMSNGLIEGVNTFSNGKWTTSGQIYNKYIDSGTFFKIPVTEELSETELPLYMIIEFQNSGREDIQVVYDYLYL